MMYLYYYYIYCSIASQPNIKALVKAHQTATMKQTIYLSPLLTKGRSKLNSSQQSPDTTRTTLNKNAINTSHRGMRLFSLICFTAKNSFLISCNNGFSSNYFIILFDYQGNFIGNLQNNSTSSQHISQSFSNTICFLLM